MEEDSILGLGSELSTIHSTGSLSDPEEDLVSRFIDQVEAVEENLNRYLLSFQGAAGETAAEDSQQDTMSDIDSQDGGNNPLAAATQVPSNPPEFVE